MVIFIFYSPQFGHTDFGHNTCDDDYSLGVNLIEKAHPTPGGTNPLRSKRVTTEGTFALPGAFLAFYVNFLFKDYLNMPLFST